MGLCVRNGCPQCWQQCTLHLQKLKREKFLTFFYTFVFALLPALC